MLAIMFCSDFDIVSVVPCLCSSVIMVMSKSILTVKAMVTVTSFEVLI